MRWPGLGYEGLGDTKKAQTWPRPHNGFGRTSLVAGGFTSTAYSPQEMGFKYTDKIILFSPV